MEGSADRSAPKEGEPGDASKEESQQEGMGQTYKAFAILPASRPVPLPFN